MSASDASFELFVRRRLFGRCWFGSKTEQYYLHCTWKSQAFGACNPSALELWIMAEPQGVDTIVPSEIGVTLQAPAHGTV